MPLSSYRMVNADEFGQLLEHLRINVPSSIRESERMLAERDKILSEARSEALRMSCVLAFELFSVSFTISLKLVTRPSTCDCLRLSRSRSC